MSDKQLAALAESSQKKKRSALAKTEKAIAILVENKQKITVRSVAREAGVSVSYIYKYPELAYKIQTLREQQKYSLIQAKPSQNQDAKEVVKLEQENLKLKREIEELKLYLSQGKNKHNSLAELQQENLKLSKENEELKRSLAYTEQKLQSAREFILGQGQLKNVEDEAQVEKNKNILPATL